MSTALLESALQKHRSVFDCAILEGRRGDAAIKVAYVVFSGPVTPDRLDDHIESTMPGASRHLAYVPVAAIPLDGDGNVDREVLERVPIVDEVLERRLEEKLAKLPGVEASAVVVEEHRRRRRHLHLSRVTPDWTRRPTSDSGDSDRGASEQQIGSAGHCRAQSSGPYFQPDGMDLKGLGDVLQATAVRSSQEDIRYISSAGKVKGESYAELKQRASRVANGLQAHEVSVGQPVVFQMDDNADFIGAFWGCVAGGFVPVPVAVPPIYQEESGATEKLLSALELLGKPLVIVSRSRASQLEDLVGRKGLGKIHFAILDDLERYDPLEEWQSRSADDVALMMLTSGSTGAPKAVMLTHRNLISRCAASKLINDFSSHDVSLNWMPLDHVAGIIYFHLRDVFLGCTQIHASTDLVLQDPIRWLDWIDQYRVTVTFAPNFAYALVNERIADFETRKWNLGSIRFFLNGAEPIVASTARRFLQLLEPHGLAPGAMTPAWGMSETSSGVTYNRDFTLDGSSDDDAFVNVGAPIPGFEMRIVNDAGSVIDEGVEGNLQVRGPTVTKGYFQNPAANEESFTADGWFDTGDLGFIRDGSLTITGRAKDVIIINSVNYYSHEIESVVDKLDGITPSYTAACPVRDANADTDQLAIFFHTVLDDDSNLVRLINEIRQAVAKQVGVTPAYLVPVAKAAIPKTGIGKIQRPLLRQQFQNGDFEEAVQRVECLMGGPNTMPSWFFRPKWVPRVAKDRIAITGDCLVLTMSSDFGLAVCAELKLMGCRVITAKPGVDFAAMSDGTFEIDPVNPAQFQLLLQKLASSGLSVEHVLLLLPYETGADDEDDPASVEGAQRHGIQTLLSMTQGLSSLAEQLDSIRLLVATKCTNVIAAADVPNLTHSAIHALTRTMSQEVEGLQTVVVDLPGESVSADALAIIGECCTEWPDSEVAFRDDRRLVRRLEELRESDFLKTESPFVEGGVYLITGGLGGIGRELAAHLLRNYEARLIIVGRSPAVLDETELTDKQLGESPAAVLKELMKLPGEVEYSAVDILDSQALSTAIEAAELRWARSLTGVVHLAATFEERPLEHETLRGLSAACAPKMRGTLNICNLLRDRSDTTLLAFSSVNGSFGGYGAGSYSAANAFLDHCVERFGRQHGVTVRCLAWSLWDETGMSHGYPHKESARRRGFQIISTSRGVKSLMAALCTGEPYLIIGLDGDNQNIRPMALAQDVVRRRLVGYVALQEAVPQCPTIRVMDLGDNMADCELQVVSSIPVNPEGIIDTASLQGRATGTTGPQRQPSTAIERSLATLWRNLLGVDSVSVDENFFDLGGSSLLMARARLEIQSLTQDDITLATLYEFPTIRSLAQHLAGPKSEAMISVEDSRKRGADRRARLRTRRKRGAGDSKQPGHQGS